jgi:hypothetical protein
MSKKDNVNIADAIHSTTNRYLVNYILITFIIIFTSTSVLKALLSLKNSIVLFSNEQEMQIVRSATTSLSAFYVIYGSVCCFF